MHYPIFYYYLTFQRTIKKISSIIYLDFEISFVSSTEHKVIDFFL